MTHIFIDESTPRLAPTAVLYGLAAVEVRDNIDFVEAQLKSLLDRKRPLHWEREGAEIKDKFVALMAAIDVVGDVAVMPTDPKGQGPTRRHLLTDRLAPRILGGSSATLLIEQRSRAEDSRDRGDLRSWCRETGVKMPRIEHISKDVPGAWLADALAGIGTDAVLGRDPNFLSTLIANGSLRSFELVTDVRRPHAGTWLSQD